MIAIENLSFRYPHSDFRLGIRELDIPPNSKTAIVGPSGSGKTTLLNLIAGINIPQQGSITADSIEVSSLSDAHRRNFRISKLGMVFQRFELIEYLDVVDNILVPFLINQTLSLTSTIKTNARQLATSMGLQDKLSRRPSRLSQGEQQRVAICRALITSPKILLADEPTGNLDPRNKQLIMNLLFEQATDNGQTLIVVTHDMSILNGFDTIIDFEDFLLPDSNPGSETESSRGIA